MLTLIWLMQLILVPALSPLLIGIIRKIKAKLQNRRGAGVFQPYRDIWKYLHKDEVISADASWVFRSAPYIIFASTLVIGASIPLFASFLKNAATGDLLMIVYTLALGTFWLALAGLDTGGGFGGFGASREMTLAALAEAGFIFALFTAALIMGTTNLFTIAGAGTLLITQFSLPTILAGSGFFIILLAETGRFPFDNPATHLELTMIHEAMILEYSGKRLALVEWAAANKFFIFAALGANLFFPVGIAQSASGGAIMLGVAALLAKIFSLGLVVAVIESTMAKFRFFRLPDLLLTAFILSAVAIGLSQIL